jgi:hypothetical protein
MWLANQSAADNYLLTLSAAALLADAFLAVVACDMDCCGLLIDLLLLIACSI